MTETGWQWRTSCALNGILGGRSDEPLCSRAWRCAWALFIDAMQIAWRDPVPYDDMLGCVRPAQASRGALEPA